MDKLELIYDLDTWLELRKIRNALAHEYEDDSEEISQIINKIYDEKETLKSFFYQIYQFVIDKTLLT